MLRQEHHVGRKRITRSIACRQVRLVQLEGSTSKAILGSKGKYQLDLSGKGAEIYGGRWNSKGVAMLCTSQSQALAFAEVAIHIPVGIVPKDYFLISISVPDTAGILKLADPGMPTDWRSNPHSNSTQRIGDKFIVESKYLILQGPSAIVPGDFNFLINPNHSQTKDVKLNTVETFEFDSRFVANGK